MVDNIPDVNDPQFQDDFEDYVVIGADNIVVNILHAENAEIVQQIVGEGYTVKLFDHSGTKPPAWVGAEFLGDEVGYSLKPFVPPLPPEE